MPLAARAPRRRPTWVATAAAAALVAVVAIALAGAARASAAAGDCIDTFDCYSLAQAVNNSQPFTAHQQSFDVTTDLTGDTVQQGERRNCILPNNGGLTWGNNSAWYRFDAGVNGSLAVSATAEGNFKVMLVQYEASHGDPINFASNADLPSGQCTGNGPQEAFDTPLSVHTNGPTFVQVLVWCGTSPSTSNNPCPATSPAGPVTLHFTFTCTDSDNDGVCDTVDQCPAVPAATATGCPAPPAPPVVTPLRTSVGPITANGTHASVSVSCAGPAGQTCTGRLAFAARVRKRGSRITGLVSPGARNRTGTTVETLAAASYVMAVGHSDAVPLSLSAAGRQLLARFYRLPGTLTVTGPGTATRSMTFAYPVVDSGLAESDFHTCPGGRCTTTLDRLTLTQLSLARTVTVTCLGGGCPFARRVVTPHGHQLALAPLFAGHHLTPGSLVTVTVSAPGAVARVFTVAVARVDVNATVACLAPGAHVTTACPA
jgi:hypothetical protein